jgi:hypothetical protein
MTLQSPASYQTIFFKWREKGWSCVHCASPLTSLPLHPHVSRDQVIWRGQYMWNGFVGLKIGSDERLLGLWCWKFGFYKMWGIFTKWVSVLRCLINRFTKVGGCMWNRLDRVQQQIFLITDLPSVSLCECFPPVLWVAKGLVMGIKWITFSCFTLFGI